MTISKPCCFIEKEKYLFYACCKRCELQCFRYLIMMEFLKIFFHAASRQTDGDAACLTIQERVQKLFQAFIL